MADQAASMFFVAINPATGEEIARKAQDDIAAIEEKIERVARVRQAWRSQSLPQRTAALRQLADALESEADQLAGIMTLEMGKPLAQAKGEVSKCALLCRHVAEHGFKALEPQSVAMGESEGIICFEPLGLLFGIMPWNFPFWQTLRFAVPALMAGNGILIKHAPNVPGCADALVRLFHEAGIAAFEHLAIDTDQAAGVIADPRIAAVSLTGSRRAGRAVAALAGKHLKKSVLELGGSDPYLVLDDADINLAASVCATGRLMNSGQTCISAKRWIVVDAVYDAFRAAVIDQLNKAVVGDPTDAVTTVGPMAREDLRAALHHQVQASIAAGAVCVMGGELPNGPGFYYPVTLLEGVRPGMPAFDDELFGPVAALIRAEDEADAIRLANHSTYGLGAGVFSSDRDRALNVAGQLQAGNVAINDFVKSDPRMPFGGIKESGYGRELSDFGMHEFVNIKSVVVK